MKDLQQWRLLNRKSNRMVEGSYLNTPKPLHAAFGDWFSYADCARLPSILDATNSLLGGSTVFGYVSGLRWGDMTLEWHTDDDSLPFVILWLCTCGYVRERDGFTIVAGDNEDAFAAYQHEPEETDELYTSDSDDGDNEPMEREINGVSSTRWTREGMVLTVYNSEVGALGSVVSQTDGMWFKPVYTRCRQETNIAM